MLGFIRFFHFYGLYIINIVSKHVYIIYIDQKWNQKPCINTKKVIDTGKRSKTLTEVKPVENISKNPKSLLQISPKQKEVLPSHKLRDHTYE